jgi:hypothetical protein
VPAPPLALPKDGLDVVAAWIQNERREVAKGISHMRSSPFSLLRPAAIATIDEERYRETGAAAIPRRPNGLVHFISRDR